MGNITGASLAPIYERINGTANYHPYDAETFSDWSLEAGDLVKVVRGDENYKSPIHSSSLVWTGSPNMTLTSTGNQAREAVAKVSKKKYARSGFGRRNNKKNNGMWHTIEETDEYYRIIYADEFNGLHSSIEQTASYWRSTLEDTKNSLRSQIEQTASYWRAQLNDDVRELQGKIDVQADRIGLVVEGTGSNAHIRPAEIVASINSQTGSSHVLIGADQVAISGRTTINDVFTIGDRRVYVKIPMRVEGDIMAESITLRTHGGNGATIDEDDITNMIVSASVSGNVLTLTPLTGSAITFSKATSLSGEWSGDNTGVTATITVTASPQDTTYSSHLNLHLNNNAAYVTDPAGTIRARIANTPYSTVTITSIALAHQYSSLTDSETRTNVYIEAKASNGASKDDALFTLANTTFSGGSKHCVNLLDGSTVIGRVNIENVYTAGYNGAHLSGAWDKSSTTVSRNNRITITKVATGSTNSLNYIISASATIGWISSLNKFRATAQAKVDGTVRGSDATNDSGVISIALGSIQGSGGGAYRTASVKNGDTAIVTSGNITDYGDGYTAGYNAGWNAACALISRSGNSIIGPVTGKATATSGQTETKYTANYTASSHSYTAAKYTASSYTKESHSYTASSHSFTQATCKTNGTNHTKYYYNSNFSGSIEYTPASDSYTASKHSYTASSYTASSFTAASHSYTASSFSWS